MKSRMVIMAMAFLFLLGIAEGITRAEGNLVPNPSFEKGTDNGKVEGWKWGITSTGGAGDCRGRWEREGHSGKRSISIDEERWFSSSEWVTKVRGIEPHSWYLLSLWTKRDRATGWLPQVILFGQERSVNIRRVGKWERFDWIINSKDLSGSVKLKLKVYKKPYKVWFDDVRLERFSIPLLSPGEKKITRNRLVTFSWTVLPTKSLLNYTLEFSRDRNFLNNVMSIKGIRESSYTPLEKLSFGRWFWRVKAYKNEVELSSSKVGEFVITDQRDPAFSSRLRRREVWIGKDGFLRVGGRPFFPIGIYSPPQSAYEEVKKAGFNVIVTGSDLNEAYKAGLKVIVPFPPKKEVKDILDNPALLAWMLWDEPGQHNVSPEEVWERDLEVKAVDYFHPTALVVYYPENYWTYASVSDIFMVDPYPIPQRPITVVSDSVDAARKAVGDKKPVWAIIQAFNWKKASAEARRVGIARLHTYEEERCMAFLAIVHGAKGILFFSYNQGDTPTSKHWKGMKKLARELARISPVLLAPDGAHKVVVDSDKLDAKGKPAIHYLTKRFKKKNYLMAVNVLNEPVRATFTQLPSNFRVTKVLFGRGNMEVDKGKFTDLFPPYGVRIYLIRKGVKD